MALDYRVPFYKRLNELFKGQFYFLYSSNRYKLSGHENVLKSLKEALGANAIEYKGEKLFNTYTKSFKKYDAEHGKRIPIVFGLFNLIIKQHPDVLITEGFFQWTPIILLYSIIFQKPVFIGYERTMWTERNAGKLKKWHRKLTDFFVRGYLVNGSETKKYLISIGIKEEKIHIGGMSADSRGLREGIKRMSTKEVISYRNKFLKHPDGLLYLFSGQDYKRKGLPQLLEAWTKHINRYPNDALVVIGKASTMDFLIKEYNTFKSIYFEGLVKYENVYKYYAISDVFILPTIEDNWSLVIPEAMACGLPVATSIYNGCYPELVKHGVNGTTFDTFKIDSINEALEYLHHANLKEFGKNSIILEESFNTENSALREYNGIIQGLEKNEN